MSRKLFIIHISSEPVLYAKGSVDKERWSNSSLLPKDGGLDYSALSNIFAVCLLFVSSCIWLLCELFIFANLVEKITPQQQKLRIFKYPTYWINFRAHEPDKFYSQFKEELRIKWPEQGSEVLLFSFLLLESPADLFVSFQLQRRSAVGLNTTSGDLLFLLTVIQTHLHWWSQLETEASEPLLLVPRQARLV